MHSHLLAPALCLALAALPGALAAQIETSAQVTFESGLYTGTPEALYRLHIDGAAQSGRNGMQAAAVFGGLAPGQSLTDLRLILYQDRGARWRYGTELQYSTDPALGGADYALGFRLRYADAGGTVDTRFALFEGGPDGAFSVTVAMEQDLNPGARVNGLLHRYSTNKEIGDLFAIGLGGTVDLPSGLSGYGQAIWSLADDFSEETTSATLGLRRDIAPGVQGFAGLTARQTQTLGASYGLTAGVTLALSDGTALFQTNPFGQQLAHIGH